MIQRLAAALVLALCVSACNPSPRPSARVEEPPPASAAGGMSVAEARAIALALGARGVLLGRPVLWALAAGGENGVARALAIMREEFEIALALLGTPAPSAVTRAHTDGRA